MILVTGAAGFIGAAVAQALLARGEQVVGIDNLNDYYEVSLKEARLARLAAQPGFLFRKLDISDRDGVLKLGQEFPQLDRIVHLAAQAGVRYSLENPRAYIHANIAGHLEILELCRAAPDIEHLVYASSSSVYGGNTKVPFSESDRVDHPLSLYAATKKADELMSSTYSHLFGLPQTGLRFFTVYGPWGRPDMASWIFTEAMLAGTPIRVFNHGEMWRDFTYVDDIVDGVVAVLDKPPIGGHALYNIGNSQPVHLGRFIDTLESLLGVKAIRHNEPMQAGEVEKTYADTSALERDFGFKPKVPIEEGLRNFVDWYRQEWRPEGKR